jgi:fatty acid desaturase (delta-4 desaturase)
MVGGFYLSFFFILSHNFDGVFHYDEEQSTPFLRKQVTTSSNVAGQLLCTLNGGLNYQIEHHLFPRIHHCHYPKIASIVKNFCDKRNIAYVHFPSLLDNVKSCISYLQSMGKLPPQICIKYKND